jgi:serine/threonine-protein kinase
MGEVFEAVDPGGRTVALKLLLRSRAAAGPAALERFLREARLLARIRHPNVVAVHDLGEAPEGPYLVTDLVEGRELGDVLDDGPLAPKRAAEVVRALCGAVGELHAAGVLHRDLKPENVILKPDGAPVLLDFGLAREMGSDALTRTGQLLGTPAYFSPEQARGVSPSSLDGRVDVYALGAVLYACLTGRPPFVEAQSMPELVGAIVGRAPKPPSKRNPAVPRALDRVTGRALAKAKEARYSSAEALGEDLERFLRGELGASRWVRRAAAPGPVLRRRDPGSRGLVASERGEARRSGRRPTGGGGRRRRRRSGRPAARGRARSGLGSATRRGRRPS